jgi:acyl carrier protein
MESIQKLRQFVTKELVPDFKGTLSEDESLLKNGVLDSMRIVKLLAYLEKEFGVEISDDEFDPDNFESLNAIARLIAEKKTG